MGRADRDWKVPVHRVTWLPRLATITIKSCATCLQPISMVTVHLTCKTHSPSFYRRKCQHNWVEQSRAGAKTHTLWNTESSSTELKWNRYTWQLDLFCNTNSDSLVPKDLFLGGVMDNTAKHHISETFIGTLVFEHDDMSSSPEKQHIVLWAIVKTRFLLEAILKTKKHSGELHKHIARQKILSVIWCNRLMVNNFILAGSQSAEVFVFLYELKWARTPHTEHHADTAWLCIAGASARAEVHTQTKLLELKPSAECFIK